MSCASPGLQTRYGLSLMGCAMMRSISGVALALACAWSGNASAYQVVHNSAGSSDYVDLWYVGLPGPGTYQFHAKSSVPVLFNVTAGYEYHPDLFLAPAPKPHSEFVEGHNSPYATGVELNGTGSYWTFVVPETQYYFFNADANLEYAGIPAGTPMYWETKYMSPYFSLFADAADGSTFKYSFTVLRMTAVPEPATWAMMIVGFGAVGSMVRTSRRRNAFGAA